VHNNVKSRQKLRDTHNKHCLNKLKRQASSQKERGVRPYQTATYITTPL